MLHCRAITCDEIQNLKVRISIYTKNISIPMAVLKGQMPLQYFLGQTLRTVAIDGETRASAIKGSSTGCHS